MYAIGISLLMLVIIQEYAPKSLHINIIIMLITFVLYRWYHAQTVLFNDAENAVMVSATYCLIHMILCL